jgi:hypothetical protein
MHYKRFQYIYTEHLYPGNMSKAENFIEINSTFNNFLNMNNLMRLVMVFNATFNNISAISWQLMNNLMKFI